MRLASSFRDHEVYKLPRELSKEIFYITKAFPSDEKYSLTDQIRRSSRSVGSQIAEAWVKKVQKAFQKIYLLDKCSSIGRMVNSMMTKSNQFCQNIH